MDTYPSIPVVQVVTSSEGLSLGSVQHRRRGADAAWLELKQRDSYLETIYKCKSVLDGSEGEQ